MKKTIRNLACVSLAVLMLAGCGKVPQLKDGSELVIELNGLKMTTEEFYQKLKDSYGTNTLINSIDELLLNKVYETDSELKTKVESQITAMKNEWGSDFEQAINYYYGVSTEKQLYDFIEMSFKREMAVKDYAKTLIKDEDIKKYYDEKAVGDIKASHILIQSEATDDMTADEKIEAEEAAVN